MAQRNTATAFSAARHPEISELYREIFDRSSDAIAIVDVRGHYLEQNAAHQALTGYSDSDLRNQTPAIHLGAEGFAKVVNTLRKEGRYRGVLESRSRDGVQKKVDLAAFAVCNCSGAQVYYVGIKRDITEHERLAVERGARLRELEALYSLTRALNQAHEPEQIYAAAIDALITAVRADRASVLVYDDDNLMHFKAWHGLSEAYRRAVDGHSPWQRDERNATTITVPDVFVDPTLRSYAPTFDREGICSVAFIPVTIEGHLLGKFMVYYNQPHCFSSEEIRIAEALATQIAIAIHRRHTENALRRSETLAAAGKLAATVAHEINNPLEGIMNLAFLLRHQVGEDETALRYLDDLENELKRVALISRRTLAFYRDTQPHGRIWLRPLTEEIVQLFRLRLQTASIAVECSVQGDPSIPGSAGEIRQALLNLFTNAMEAIGTKGRIDIELSETPEGVKIVFSDNGPGLDPAQTNRIFEPFFTTKTSTGTGLGLALTREIIKRHGGTISAANRSSGGAVFTIEFPHPR